MVRLGTAASESLALGTQVIAASATQAGGSESLPDATLCESAKGLLAGARVGPVTSADVHLDPSEGAIPEGGVAADLSTASLYEAARQLGIASLSILVVSETPEGVAPDEIVETAMKAIAPPALRLLA
jgi:purine-nucleoside phosphorylase